MKFRYVCIPIVWLVTGAHGGIVFSNLFSFDGTNGSKPASLVQDGANLFGTTSNGGTNGGNGTIFRITSEGTFNMLVSFSGTNGPCLGTSPNQLLKDPDGNFYGTTFGGGTNDFGTVFRMTPDGTLTTLLSFTGTNGPCLGANPSQLIRGTDGHFYGTTRSGGTTNQVQNFGFGWNYGNGTVFQITTNLGFNTLLLFTGTNGACPGRKPSGGLLQGLDGNLYGITEEGGLDRSSGTVFKTDISGTLIWSFSFWNTNGYQPRTGLIQASDGNLYGTTGFYANSIFGGPAGSTVFKISTNGALNTLMFLGPLNFNPRTKLVQGTDGNLYGTTVQGGTGFNGMLGSGNGSVFRLTLSGAFSNIHNFAGGTSGSGPVGGLIQADDGNFYGVANSGGINNNGIVYRLSLPLQPSFQTSTLRQADGNLSFTWNAVSGQTYQIQYNTNLTTTNWSNLGGAVTATNGTVTAFDATSPDPRRYYRINVVP